jgi:hypothetical protein
VTKVAKCKHKAVFWLPYKSVLIAEMQKKQRWLSYMNIKQVLEIVTGHQKASETQNW